MASGRNLASGGGDGLTKVLYCSDTYRILGVTIVGKNAGDTNSVFASITPINVTRLALNWSPISDNAFTS